MKLLKALDVMLGCDLLVGVVLVSESLPEARRMVPAKLTAAVVVLRGFDAYAELAVLDLLFAAELLAAGTPRLGVVDNIPRTLAPGPGQLVRHRLPDAAESRKLLPLIRCVQVQGPARKPSC